MFVCYEMLRQNHIIGAQKSWRLDSIFCELVQQTTLPYNKNK